MMAEKFPKPDPVIRIMVTNVHFCKHGYVETVFRFISEFYDLLLVVGLQMFWLLILALVAKHMTKMS